ncbi:hypothetical protein C1645_772705, partial [Glomus cerebriforme]
MVEFVLIFLKRKLMHYGVVISRGRPTTAYKNANLLAKYLLSQFQPKRLRQFHK